MKGKPSSLLVAVALTLAAFLLGACAPASGSGGSGQVPDSPTSNSPSPGSPIPSPSPSLVRPRPGLVDPRPASWETVEVVDQSTLELQFYGGVEDCYGVDHVDVAYGSEAVTVTIYEGRVPTAEVCIEIAVLKSIRVELDEPLDGRKVVDGADK